jgi:FixJ family two-component response regulator
LPTRKSVLIVDDDPSMRTSMSRLLRKHGFDATTFESANALLGHADLNGAACLILDVNLLDQSGIELRRQLLTQGVMVPVIYVTGNDSGENRSAALKSGCAAYLTKPFAAKSFMDSVERASAGSASHPIATDFS